MEYGIKDGSQAGRKSGGIGRNQTPICRNPATIIPTNEYKYVLEIPEEDQSTPQNQDTSLEPVTITIALYAVAHPFIAAGAIAATAFIVSAAAKWKEKRDRKKHNLPDQPQLEVKPFIDPVTKISKLNFTVSGSYPGRRILLKIGKGKFYGLLDPVISDRKGDGEIIIDGDLLLSEAKNKKIIDIGLPTITSGQKNIWVYVQEVRPLLGDLRSPITRVDIEVKGIMEKIAKEIKEELFALKKITPAEADQRVKEGLPSYIKINFPILSALPGLPYTPGMWIPWGFMITETP